MPRRRALSLAVVLAFVLGATVAIPAHGQSATAATVTRVIDGDTLEARLADGQPLTVRLIGIDAPEVGECGSADATGGLRELVEGQPVNLVSDPTQDTVDRFGRSLFYVDRSSDGLDAGEEMLRLGWAELFVFERDFARLGPYMDAEAGASDFGVASGVGAAGTFTSRGRKNYARGVCRLRTSCGTTTGPSPGVASHAPGEC